MVTPIELNHFTPLYIFLRAICLLLGVESYRTFHSQVVRSRLNGFYDLTWEEATINLK